MVELYSQVNWRKVSVFYNYLNSSGFKCTLLFLWIDVTRRHAWFRQSQESIAAFELLTDLRYMSFLTFTCTFNYKKKIQDGYNSPETDRKISYLLKWARRCEMKASYLDIVSL